MQIHRLAWLPLVLTLAACSTADDALPGPAKPPATPLPQTQGCNPIAQEWDCLLPWPSDTFRDPTQHRVRVPAVALPHMRDQGPAIDFQAEHPIDGFSLLPTVAVRIPGGVSAEGLVPFPLAATPTVGLEASLSPTSPTLLVDAETHALVPHFAEVDPRPDSLDDRVLLLRPVVRLTPGHRYLVALHGLKHPDGSAVLPPQGPSGPGVFQQLRDGTANPALTALRAHYDAEVFAPLTQAGIERPSLILAWDFTTQTEASAQGELLTMRTLALQAMQTLPVAVTVTQVDVNPGAHIALRIEGELTVPLFLETAQPGARLFRGPDGHVAQHGTAQVPFTLLVPPSVLQAGQAAPVLQFGHGFFGTRHEIDDPEGPGKPALVATFADETARIAVAVDWWGMSKPDLGVLSNLLVTDTGKAMGFVDRVDQAMINQLALAEAVNGALRTLPPLQKDGHSLVDPTRLGYFGISLGHILGATYVALSPRIERAALNVGGMGFGLILSRANPFGPFEGLLDLATGDVATSLHVTLLLQTTLDRIDPIVLAPHLLTDTLPGCPKTRRVLQQDGRSDTHVPNVASHVQARTLGVPQLGPASRQIYGVKEQAGPIEGSALVEYDWHKAVPDVLPVPVDKSNGVHQDTRWLKAVRAQVDQFLATGVVVQTCGGVCDPE
jgi:hypothetical protein